MQNVLLFIRQFFVLLTFVALQIFCIVLLSRSSRSHHAFFAGAYNEVVGSINGKYFGLTGYFKLREENKRLLEDNLKLRNQLSGNFETTGRQDSLKVDTTKLNDSTFKFQKYVWRQAQVVGNSLNVQNNFITLQRGTQQGVSEGMAVLSSDGYLIGKVEFVSGNFAKVMSLINRFTKVSAEIYGKAGTGGASIEWDGKDIEILNLTNVGKSTKVSKGDTVQTTNYSSIYPAGIFIGFVDTVLVQQDAPTLLIKVRTAAKFRHLQNAYVVENVLKKEQDELEKKELEKTKTN
jgi:rod shape-determining protein MreC